MVRSLKIFALIMVSVFAMGMAACATKDKSAVEVEVSQEELDRQRMEELKRQEEAELKRMREEERAREEEAAMLKAREEFEEVSALEAIYFDFDKYDLKQPARDALARNADWLKVRPGYQVQIEGHCDERGSDEYNLALGERRAMAAKNYLVSLGISENRIYTISYGEEMPVDPGHNESAWSKNRRDEFKVSKIGQ